MAELLPTVGTVSYNGVVFGAKTETLSIDSRMVYDQARRTVAYVVHTITLQGIVYNNAGSAAGTSDDNMTDIRRLLSQPGAEFHYDNSKGFGGLTINLPAGGGTRDVVWGPKPQLLKYKPVGSNRVAEVTWTVEVAIPECSNARYSFSAMEWNYRLSVTVDQSGYSRRTYSGYVRIPQTRATVSTRTLSDHADRLRESVTPQVPPGFRRVSSEWPLSEDKCRLDFTIVDEQLPPNAPPEDVVDWVADHTVQTRGPGVQLWTGTLSATYEVVRDKPRSLPFAHFFLMLKDRTDAVKKAQAKDNALLIASITLREPEIAGRRSAAFSAVYTFSMHRSKILAGSGLWTPVPGSDYAKWKTSMDRGNVFHPRGVAQLRFNPSDDFILDLCADRPARIVGTPVGNKIVSQAAGPKFQAGQPPGAPFENDTPSPESSWLAYSCGTAVEPVDQTVEHKLLPQQEPAAYYAGNSFSPGAMPEDQPVHAVDGASLNFSPYRTAAPPPVAAYQSQSAQTTSIIQQRAAPSIAITVFGFAIRAGYPIIPPTLLSVGGKTATPANRTGNYFRQWVGASWFGVPIVVAGWNLRYILSGVPAGQIPLPDNPLAKG